MGFPRATSSRSSEISTAPRAASDERASGTPPRAPGLPRGRALAPPRSCCGTSPLPASVARGSSRRPLRRAGDAEIARLPITAELEIEIEEDPIAWTGPVALVTGVLTVSPTLFPLAIETADNARLTASRAFVDAMQRAHSPDDDGIAARRAMKRLCAPLFAVYLERRVLLRRGR